MSGFFLVFPGTLVSQSGGWAGNVLGHEPILYEIQHFSVTVGDVINYSVRVSGGGDNYLIDGELYTFENIPTWFRPANVHVVMGIDAHWSGTPPKGSLVTNYFCNGALGSEVSDPTFEQNSADFDLGELSVNQLRDFVWGMDGTFTVLSAGSGISALHVLQLHMYGTFERTPPIINFTTTSQP